MMTAGLPRGIRHKQIFYFSIFISPGRFLSFLISFRYHRTSWYKIFTISLSIEHRYKPEKHFKIYHFFKRLKLAPKIELKVDSADTPYFLITDI